MRKIFLLLYLILPFSLMAQGGLELEPNNSFETANWITEQTQLSGVVNKTSDQNDYFMTILPTDGTLEIYVKGTNQANTNAYLYMYGYDRRKANGQIFATYIHSSSNQPGSVVYDTLKFYGRASDTFYFRLFTNENYAYTFSYKMTDLSANDAEPNNEINSALPIVEKQKKAGHIGYLYNGTSDQNDYYKTNLPADGTLKIYVKGTNRSGGSGYLFMYGYDRRKMNGQIFSEYIQSNSIAAGATINDTITIYGRAVDSFYFRLISSVAFDYEFSYEMVDVTPNDVEPNNTFEEALTLPNKTIKQGHVNYWYNGTSDQTDFYKTLLPNTGTLRVFIEGTNKGGADGYLYLYGYDNRKANGTVFSTYVSGKSSIPHGTKITDTLYITGREADSFYFRFTSSVAFDYKISYDMVQDNGIDSEPNNTIAQSIFIPNGIKKQGQIGYTSGGARDNDDYYYTILPTDGTLKIYVTGKNAGSASGYMYMYGYDRRKMNGQIFTSYIHSNSNPVGSTVYDTLTNYGRAADTFYFRITSSVAYNYEISYEMVDVSENDVEPNNKIELAIPMKEKETKKGHIGFLSNGTSDADDYYSTVLPEDGLLKVYVKGTNRSGAAGYLYMYGYDRRKMNGQIFSTYIHSNSNPAGSTIYDTLLIYGRAADTFYFRIISSAAYSYEFSYEMSDVSENDVEPNNKIELAIPIKEKEIKKGHIGYLFNGTSDTDDYYSTLIPEDGTMKVYVKGTNRSGGAGYLYMYGYDRRKMNGQLFSEYIQNNSVASGMSISDTIVLYGRAVDSFYFRIISSVAFDYELYYEIVDKSETDAEPNNDINSPTFINHKEVKKGHIGYAFNGTTDTNDFYKAVLPEGGSVRVILEAQNRGGGNGEFYFYAYDSRKLNGNIFTKYITGSTPLKPGESIRDTLLLPCRGVDTLYYRIMSNTAFSYSISYDVIGVASPDDVAGNDNYEKAQAVDLKTVVHGRIGYLVGGVSDGNDYFRTLLPQVGNVKIIVKGTHNGTGTGQLNFYIYNNRKQLVGSKLINNNSAVPKGGVVTDTLVLNCVLKDTLYVRVMSTGCFNYEFSIDHISMQPHADMTYERLGNTFGFRPQLSNADNFIWNFGDGTTSNSEFPMKTYGPGSYTAQLIATQSKCNLKDTAKLNLVIKGVEYFTPDKAGVGGDLNLSIFGGGLEEATKVSLIKGSTTLAPLQKFSNSKQNHLTAVFDIHLVETGLYDVLIEIKGEDPIRYNKALKIDSLIYPTTWSEVTGPDRWRNNVETKFNLTIGNNGNVMASGVVVAMAWPKGVTVTWDSDLYKPVFSGSETVTVDGEVFSLPRSEYKFIYDELQTITPIDSFNLKPFDGYVQYFLVAHVPAGSRIEIPFTAKSTGLGLANFMTYTFKTNQRGSCDNPVFTDYNENVTAELIDFLDMGIDKYGIPPLKVLSKTAKIGQKHAGSAASYMGKKFWAWYDGYEFDGDAAMADLLKETEANNAFALQTATDELGSLLFDVGSAKLASKYQGQIDFINNRLANNPNMSATLKSKYLEKLNSAEHQLNRFEGLKNIFKSTKDLGTLSDKLLTLQKIIDDCPELKPQLEDLIKDLEKELNLRDPKEKNTNRVTSFDPNEISGPIGVGTNRYVNNFNHHHFRISFENVDTALAAAQIVVIRDTIDKDKYDLNTFEFGNVTIGKKTHRVPNGRKEFVIERNIVQDLPLKVRINASIDTTTGIIVWQFTSIDTTTGTLPVLEGFLPPNKNKPEGEGSVGFSVRPRLNLPDGTHFINRAEIIFDQNESIMTNTWINILDIGKPTSSLKASLLQDTLIKIDFSGTDAVSGMGYYNLFVSVNDGEWRSFTGTSADTLLLEGQKDSTYSFYVQSIDKVGNPEKKNPTVEARIKVKGSLHISMGDISAVNIGQRNRVDWNTLGEDVGDYFVIERSFNGSNFSPIANVLAKGSASTYSFIDESPANGINYYRLKIVEKDGKGRYTKVVTAEVKNKEAFALQLYPNPVREVLKVRINGNRDLKAVVTLTSVEGSILYGAEVKGAQVEIDMRKMAKGIYFFNYRDGKNDKTIKVVKE